VQVVRDSVGVPHVYAHNEPDAYFMVGYLHAQDRLFQMDQSRRQASGTLAELLGPGDGNRVLESDVQLRTIGLRRRRARSTSSHRRLAPDSTPTPPASMPGSAATRCRPSTRRSS
jgi:penicillin amidase